MPGFLANMTFINPWILAGLVFLPTLWFLLRVTPPAPKRIRFPAARFLAGLRPDEHTTSRTPWWILLLRLLTAALVIIALARPLLNPSEAMPGRGAVRIVIDNGWAAAQTWTLQNTEAAALAARAGREKREIYILTTAPEPGKDAPVQYGPLTQGQAESLLTGLNPMPWPAAYKQTASIVRDNARNDSSITSFWLSHGLQDAAPAPLIQILRQQGELHIIQPDAARLPVLLRPVPYAGMDLKALISVPPTLAKGTPITVQAIGSDGRILDTQALTINSTEKSLDINFDLPPALRQQIAQIRLSGRQGAGAVLMLDDTVGRKVVGIVSPAGADENAPLVDESYYLRRALEPYAELLDGTINDLLAKKPAVLILPDIGTLPPDELNRLENWVRQGGLLLRFAGPHMTQGDIFLTPAPLFKGGRAMDGALTWEKPPRLASFPERSPYYGLTLPEDITVSRQILAEPTAELENMSWATLEDGTPLITARELERGLLVMVHTTATPQWSDFALSGLFVQILKRTVALAGRSTSFVSPTGALQPLLVLDGFGRTAQPGSFVQPIANDDLEKIQPSSIHPPGIYGRAGFQKAINLGTHLPALKTLKSLPSGVGNGTYEGKQEAELMPHLLTAAFILFLCDWITMIFLQTGFYSYYLRRQSATAAAIVIALLIYAPINAHAEMSQQDMIKYASELHLAHVRTGISQIDITAHNGLSALADVLARRTSVEPDGIVAINPATDDLSFFPLIYWPLTPGQTELSPQAVRNIQSYLNHGGTILFDTRDQLSAPGANAKALQAVTSGIDIPPLIRMPADHVVTRTFYLMQDFPDRYDAGTMWTEENNISGRDGVSSVIISNHDWASAWAAADTGKNRYGSGPRQGEMALRFGVNIVMYALTGNYKADQVHLPHILERLGQ